VWWDLIVAAWRGSVRAAGGVVTVTYARRAALSSFRILVSKRHQGLAHTIGNGERSVERRPPKVGCSASYLIAVVIRVTAP